MEKEYLDLVSNLIPLLGGTDFKREFSHVCRDIFRNDQCTVFSFKDNGAPECILSTASQEEMRRLTTDLAKEYVADGYRVDQTLAWAKMRHRNKDISVTRSVTAQDISDPKYRRVFYDNAGVRAKIALVAFQGDTTYYLNLYRNPDQNDFTSRSKKLLEQFGQILYRLLAKHQDIIKPAANLPTPTKTLSKEFQADLLGRVRKALLAEKVGLTEREAEVCAFIAMGVSAAGISYEKGISINTVATHRKRAYAKLEISSQNELFARYYEGLTTHARGLSFAAAE